MAGLLLGVGLTRLPLYRNARTASSGKGDDNPGPGSPPPASPDGAALAPISLSAYAVLIGLASGHRA
jgi:hypothetical protein